MQKHEVEAIDELRRFVEGVWWGSELPRVTLDTELANDLRLDFEDIEALAWRIERRLGIPSGALGVDSMIPTRGRRSVLGALAARLFLGYRPPEGGFREVTLRRMLHGASVQFCEEEP